MAYCNVYALDNVLLLWFVSPAEKQKHIPVQQPFLIRMPRHAAKTAQEQHEEHNKEGKTTFRNPASMPWLNIAALAAQEDCTQHHAGGF